MDHFGSNGKSIALLFGEKLRFKGTLCFVMEIKAG